LSFRVGDGLLRLSACLSTTHGGRSVALEQFLTMKTVETHFAADAMPFSIIAKMSVVYWPNVSVTKST
jgi:hypothetical protein